MVIYKIFMSIYRAGSTIVKLLPHQQFEMIRDGCALKQTLKILEKFDFKPIQPPWLTVILAITIDNIIISFVSVLYNSQKI